MLKWICWLIGYKRITSCICPKECDCENPDPQNRVALVSNHCPIHNLSPYPYPECEAKNHFEEESNG